MTSLLIAFFSSLIATLLIVRYQHLHHRFTADHDQSGPQKFHQRVVPRVGGLGLFIALTAILIYKLSSNHPSLAFYGLLYLVSIPAFLIGLLEDITKKIGVKLRLAVTAISAYAAIYFLGSQIIQVHILGIDTLLAITGISILFTVFAITGLANAYNIIDGFNGLASMVAMITLLAITYVAFKVGDFAILTLSLVMIGAIAGFFVWNYPRGLIFLGDGGAYLIGFYIAVLSILIVNRNPSVSPWFPLMINAYPIFETLFTIWRRKVHQGKNPGLPDGAHFHSIIYRRIVRWAEVNDDHSASFARNAKTSPYLWLLSSMAVFPALIWWDVTWILQLYALLFCVTYVWMYQAVVKFKTPRWLK